MGTNPNPRPRMRHATRAAMLQAEAEQAEYLDPKHMLRNRTEGFDRKQALLRQAADELLKASPKPKRKRNPGTPSKGPRPIFVEYEAKRAKPYTTLVQGSKMGERIAYPVSLNSQRSKAGC